MGNMTEESYEYALDSMPVNTLGQRLRFLRYKKGLSAKRVAQKTGIVISSIYRWEQGMSDPSVVWLLCLSDFYGASIDWIVRGKKTEYER